MDSWRQFFASRILYRGEDLYEAGRVGDVYKTKTGFKAAVYGTREYTVTIDMEGNRVIDMDCTCPYAAGGSHCKHEAALLMKLTYEDIDEEPSETIEDIIDHMSEAQVRDELKKHANENSDFHRYLFSKYRTKSADSSYPDKVYRELSSLENIYGDRGGFINWRSGYDYVNAFVNCLADMIRPMIDNEEYMVAFESLKRAFEVLNQVEMDGSGGEHSMIADAIQTYWDEVIQAANPEEKDKMHHWFEKMEEDSDSLICGDIFSSILDESFDEPKYLLPRLENVQWELDAMIEYPRRIEGLLPKYKSMLVRCGKDLTEYNNWLNTHSDNKAVKEIRLKEAMSTEDYDHAIQILEELLENNTNSWSQSEWENKLLDLYRKTGNKEKTKEMLIHKIFDSYSANMDEVWEVKTYCDKTEWDGLCEQILLKHKDIRPEVYYEEKLYDKLLESLLTSSDEKLNHYKNLLLNEYPEQFLRMYLARIKDISSQRAGTTLYNRMQDLFINASDIENSTADLIFLIHDLEQGYPTRKAMLRMLDTVREEIRRNG